MVSGKRDLHNKMTQVTWISRRARRYHHIRNSFVHRNGIADIINDDHQAKMELKNAGIQGVDSKLLRELGEDNVDQSIIGEEIAQLSEEYDLRAITWRQRMVHFLHTIPVEASMMFLVVVDVFIILGMVVLDMYIVQEQWELTNHKGTELLTYFNGSCFNDVSCANTTSDLQDIWSQKNIGEAYAVLVEQLTLNGDLSEDDLEIEDMIVKAQESHSRRKRASGGEPHAEDFGKEHSYEAAKMIYNSTKANHILHYCSIAILAVFVVEVGLKIIGYGKNYFKNKWEVIDGVVIIISFALDVAVTDANFSHEVGKTVLVVFLMWRVIRILNAMVLTSRARTMFRLRVLRKSKRIAEDKNKQLSTDCTDLQTEIKRLRQIAKMYGADHHEIVSAQVLSKSNQSATKHGLKNMMAQILTLNTKIATLSSNSINRTGLGPAYNRSRRPSMIGDETMCHETKLATQASLDIPPMRQRAASDAGGMTKISQKLKNNWNEMKNRRRGSASITQRNGSNPNFSLETPEEAPAAISRDKSIGGLGASFTIENEETVFEESKPEGSEEVAPKEAANNTQPQAEQINMDKQLVRNDSGIDSPKTGITNQAFGEDEGDNNSQDSGYEQQNAQNKKNSADAEKHDSGPASPQSEEKSEKTSQLNTGSEKPGLMVPQISITIHDEDSS